MPPAVEVDEGVKRALDGLLALEAAGDPARVLAEARRLEREGLDTAGAQSAAIALLTQNKGTTE